KTVDVGDDVTLTCPRKTTWLASDLFWIRLVPGTFPEALGGMIAYNFDRVKKTNHMTAKQEPGLFVLHFSKTRLSDTAVYYCIKVEQRNMTFLKGIFLRIKGPEPDITAVTQDFLSDPVRPGDSVTLQCSVLSDSEKKTCLEDHHVYWFRARSDKSHPSLIYAHRNHSDTCEEGPEVHSPQKCVYSFSKNVSSSDAGTYYCAVATCGEIIFGNGTKLDIEVVSTCDSQEDNSVVFLLFVALAISLIVIAFLVYVITKKSCDCCKGKKGYVMYQCINISSQKVASFVYFALYFLREMRSLWFTLQQSSPGEKLTKQGEGRQQQRKRQSTLMSGLSQ
uniref:Ig-like domain-containing protein n=1 Tax=Lates calcarifer TaxID=8187 RepID=A0A4W6F916_LATCA